MTPKSKDKTFFFILKLKHYILICLMTLYAAAAAFLNLSPVYFFLFRIASRLRIAITNTILRRETYVCLFRYFFTTKLQRLFIKKSKRK